MLFLLFPKDELKTLFELLSYNCLIGPTRKAESLSGEILYGYEPLYTFSDLALHHSVTVHSAKEYFLPHRQTMARYELDGSSWQKITGHDIPAPVVFFGMHACDINALNRLDRVLLGTGPPDPVYAARRKNTFIVGIDCVPQPQCFCRSMGCDTVLHGCDMFLTDIGEDYFCEINSSTAYEVLKGVRTREPDDHAHALFMKVLSTRRNRFESKVDTTDLIRILDLEFEAKAWRKWGERCLSCGTCANVCPTCYCYGVEHEIDLDLRSAKKNRRLYSCNIVDFAEVAGGFNFRPESHVRLKYRYYHKHRGFVEAYEEPLCVGCGRCGKACLADITVPEVIASIREEAAVDE